MCTVLRDESPCWEEPLTYIPPIIVSAAFSVDISCDTRQRCSWVSCASKVTVIPQVCDVYDGVGKIEDIVESEVEPTLRSSCTRKNR